MAQTQPSLRPHPASLGCPGQHNGEIPSGPSVVTRRLPSGTLGDPLGLTPPQAPCGSSPFPGPPQPHSPPGAGWGLSPAGSWGQCAGGGAPWEDSLGRTRWPDGLRSVPAPLSDPGPVSARWAVLTAPAPWGPRPVGPSPLPPGPKPQVRRGRLPPGTGKSVAAGPASPSVPPAGRGRPLGPHPRLSGPTSLQDVSAGRDQAVCPPPAQAAAGGSR